jgi:hypothetical protein
MKTLFYNPGMQFAPMLAVRQRFPDRSLADAPGEVAREMERAGFAARVKPGARIAIGVGSRGIANIAAIVRAAAAFWKARGARPFIFPAMGSHGGATAEGQAALLAHLGVDARSAGCPLVSSPEVATLGRTPEGIEVVVDRSAWESDAIMVINRVKWHTSFCGRIESGLMKMLAIGAGKLAGAKQYHALGSRIGMEQAIRSGARRVIETGKVLGGLAVLEDANHNTAKIEAVPAEYLERREEELLELAKSWKARIPVKHLDVLIVDEIGKEISGTGMDPKVVNRSMRGEWNPWPDAPRVERIFVRGLCGGNAVGMGMADVVTDRLLSGVDWSATYLNSLTAGTPAGSRTPIHFATDRECLERIALTTGKLDAAEVTIGWIRNTLALGAIGLSETLREEIEKETGLEIEEPARAIEFDRRGNLVSPFMTR